MVLDLIGLSRAVSHALRHEPWLYELELDGEGWTSVADVVDALRSEKSDWALLTEDDLAEMIACSDKQRFEICDGQIRALYGHSIPEKIRKLPATPPEILFHGTSPTCISSIHASGLLPMNRHYVHLSTDVKTASKVGQRKCKRPVILKVHAKKASEKGVTFYLGNNKVWLADFVPVQFISIPGMSTATNG